MLKKMIFVLLLPHGSDDRLQLGFMLMFFDLAGDILNGLND